MMASKVGMLGSIDANTGSPDLGWDTDQFPMDVKNATFIMKVSEKGFEFIWWVNSSIFVCLFVLGETGKIGGGLRAWEEAAHVTRRVKQVSLGWELSFCMAG